MTTPLMQTAGYEVYSICVDRFRLDGGAMFGVVPKVLWQRICPPDPQNRISMGCQCLVLKSSERLILIDAGLGDKWEPKYRSIYAIESSQSALSPLETALQGLNICPDEITDVIVTHLHFDHAGGMTKFDSSGSLRPTFQNARHWVQAEHLDWALSPTEKDRGSFPSENITPLAKADLFCLTRGEEELFSGVGVLPLHGHTRAMQGVLIEGERPLFYPADLLPMKAHIHLPYIMAYDIDPLTTLAEKKAILKRVVEGNWLVYLEHEPEETFGSIEMFGAKYTWGRE